MSDYVHWCASCVYNRAFLGGKAYEETYALTRSSAVSTLFTSRDVKHTFSAGMQLQRRLVVKAFHFENKSRKKLLKLMFHGYKTHTHTHICLPWTHVCVRERERERERHRFSFWDLNIPVSSLPLFVQPFWLIYLSLLSQTWERSPQLWSRLPPWCVHTPTPMNSLARCFSLPSSLHISHLCLSSAFVPWELLRGDQEVWSCAPRDIISCCSLSQRLRFCLWSPKAAREDASDGFCPLFHWLPFIPMCSSRHQGRFLTSMLFRQWCHGHGDVVLCLRLSTTAEEKTQDLDVDDSGFRIWNIMTDGYNTNCSVQLFFLFHPISSHESAGQNRLHTSLICTSDETVTLSG